MTKHPFVKSVTSTDHRTTKIESTLNTLAAAARCINDADWGSERQIAAENAFYGHVESILSPANYHKLECRNWKASTDEAVDNTLAFLAEIAARTKGTR